MRKIFFSTILSVALLGSSSLFAESKVLIDFNQYEQKLASDPAYQSGNGSQNGSNGNGQAQGQNGQAAGQNGQAQGQNGQAAGNNNQAQGQNGQAAGNNGQTSGTGADGQVSYKITPDDMKIDHWIISLNSSSKQMQNIKYSYVKTVQTKGKVGAVRTVLGARIHFPEWNNNSSAEIAPPYEFPVYTEQGTPASQENGVLTNVGEMYSVTAEVYGRNFKNGFYVQLRNESGNLEKYFMGYLYYNGWRKLTWKNPLYIDNVDLRSIVRLPIFPDKGIPYKRLDSFLITRNAAEPGGDFLVYIANVNMQYDLAVVLEDEDVDQEGTWHILSDNVKAQASIENQARAELVELRKEEMKKMAIANGQANPNSGSGDNSQPAGAQANNNGQQAGAAPAGK